MKIIQFFGVVLAVFFLSGPSVVLAEKVGSKNVSDVVQTRNNVILDEFKRHHMVFLQELSDNNTLVAASAVIEDAKDNNKFGLNHDHSGNDTSYLEEDLALIILQATKDTNGKYLTPIFSIVPGKNHTYKDMYTVSIVDKHVTITFTRALGDKAIRTAIDPDQKFIRDLTKRLNGKVTEKGIVLP